MAINTTKLYIKNNKGNLRTVDTLPLIYVVVILSRVKLS